MPSAAPLSAEDVASITALLGPGGWSDDPVRIEPKLLDWRGRWRGAAALLALPGSTEKVAALIGFCARRGIAVVPQGGNTGLVGGQLPSGELLLSMERMRAVRDVAPLDDCIVVEAGVTLLEAQQAAAAVDRLFPLSLAAEGTATIGGAVSSNAGGIGVLRYGTTRDLVLGIEAVLPDGSVFQGLKRLRKDNTGYDLKQLLIGAEGTLGVVTAASLRLFPAVCGRGTAMAGLASADAAIRFLARAKALTGGAVEAFEIMSRAGVELTVKHILGVRDPLAEAHPWYVLIEVSGADDAAAQVALEGLLSDAFGADLIVDAVVAQSGQQRAELWRLREEHTAAQRAAGSSWSHDISVPVSSIPSFLAEAAAAIERQFPGARPIPFGHVGDGNIHYNVVQPERGDASGFAGAVDDGGEIVHDIVARLGGSISAEHGLGRMKSDAALRYKSSVEIATMRAVRAALDPGRIMNPGVLF